MMPDVGSTWKNIKDNGFPFLWRTNTINHISTGKLRSRMVMVKIGYYLEIVGSLFSSSVVVPDNHLLSLLLFTNSLGFFLLASTSPLPFMYTLFRVLRTLDLQQYLNRFRSSSIGFIKHVLGQLKGANKRSNNLSTRLLWCNALDDSLNFLWRLSSIKLKQQLAFPFNCPQRNVSGLLWDWHFTNNSRYVSQNGFEGLKHNAEINWYFAPWN